MRHHNHNFQNTTRNQPINGFIKSGVKFNFGRISIQNIQHTLKLSQPEDVYEQEANDLSKKAIAMNEGIMPGERYPQSGFRGLPIKNRMPNGNNTLFRFNVDDEIKAEEEEDDSEGIILLKSHQDQIDVLHQNRDLHINLNSHGRPLPTDIRSFFESRFNFDLSQIRIHTESDDTKSARTLNAEAFTIGKNTSSILHNLTPIQIKVGVLLHMN